MSSILGAQLRDDAFHVRLHRAFGDIQGLRDLAVGVATRKLLQHLYLAR